MREFKIGDQVSWSSQANSSWTTKDGVVVEVVPVGGRPDTSRWPVLKGCGWGRNHVSYIVTVGRKAYWPIVSKLLPKDTVI